MGPQSPLLNERFSPSRLRLEYPIYAALKLHLFGQLAQGRGRTLIHSRRLHSQLEKASRSTTGIAELHGVTSHFIRERLRNLNHGTILQETFPSARNAMSFIWNEPFHPEAFQAYRDLRACLGEHTPLSMDALRVAEHFDTHPFHLQELQSLFLALRHRLLSRSKYTLAVRSVAAEFTRFIQDRQRILLDLGLLEPDGPRSRLSLKGQWVVQRLETSLHAGDSFDLMWQAVARRPAV